ncbi:MAG: hypothetical protein ACI4RV_01370, partial [Eubacteriales bacterium]
MCVLKSAIILKDRVFVPDYDIHDKMLDELGIEDTAENAARLFVRAELVPIDGNVFDDINSWQYRVDQDILPEWYVEEYDKSRMIEAVKHWASEHIHVGKTIDNITDGLHYIKNSTVTAYDNSTVKAYDNSTVRAYDNSTVKAYDNSTVRAY